jgi:hypothetical protein
MNSSLEDRKTRVALKREKARLILGLGLGGVLLAVGIAASSLQISGGWRVVALVAGVMSVAGSILGLFAARLSQHARAVSPTSPWSDGPPWVPRVMIYTFVLLLVVLVIALAGASPLALVMSLIAATLILVVRELVVRREARYAQRNAADTDN